MPKQTAISKTSPRNLAAAEKAGKAVQLRLAAYSLRQIADAVGYKSVSSAHDAIMLAMRDLKQPEEAEQLRAIMFQRIEKLLRKALVKADEGDKNAQSFVIQLMNQQAKLMGLYAPQKTAITDTEGRDVDLGPFFRETLEAFRDAPTELLEQLEAYAAGQVLIDVKPEPSKGE
jgi:hypothetical protein